MVQIDIYGILFDFFDLFLNLTGNLYNFLFNEITVLDFTFRPFFLIGSGVFITLIVLWLVNKLS